MTDQTPARTSADDPARTATKRTVLMCRPEHFTVSYRINPWMHPEDPTDTRLAVQQWEKLYDTYLELGFDVHLIDPIAGLPDMVYAANGGFVLDGIAYGASFTYPERQPEGPAYMEWFGANGFDVRDPPSTNEGEGDFLLVGDVHPRRHRLPQRHPTATTRSPRSSAARSSRLNLINPSFYHLDTAIAVLDPEPIEGGRRTSPTSRAPSTSSRSRSSASCSPTRSSSPRRTPRCSASTRTATATTSSSPAARRTSSASCASAATTPSASTCPSCCSAAAE